MEWLRNAKYLDTFEKLYGTGMGGDVFYVAVLKI
jgi:hypothetical protein